MEFACQIITLFGEPTASEGNVCINACFMIIFFELVSAPNWLLKAVRTTALNPFAYHSWSLFRGISKMVN